MVIPEYPCDGIIKDFVCQENEGSRLGQLP